jgi:hypothetical protein
MSACIITSIRHGNFSTNLMALSLATILISPVLSNVYSHPSNSSAQHYLLVLSLAAILATIVLSIVYGYNHWEFSKQLGMHNFCWYYHLQLS